MSGPEPAAKIMGLSPHLRGSPRDVRAGRDAHGPIPAPAGQPTPAMVGAHAYKAYPRTCGAADYPLRAPCGSQGLSPHLRGSLGQAARDPPHLGPIPAPAGQPRMGRSVRQVNKAYPRTCGAATANPLTMPDFRGLSPHLRGSPMTAANGSPLRRPIPAPAGQPASSRSAYFAARAYPRTCGAAR